jgi:murein tripeptide amidase MpaA
MIKLKIAIVALCLSFTTSSCIFIGNAFRTGYTEKQCNQIAANFDKLKIGINKSEVINLIGEESDNKIYPNPGYSKALPEQKTQWKIWLLCQEQPYQWQMIAFDIHTQKLVKVFSDDPDTIGF